MEMSYPGIKDIIGAITEGMQDEVPYEDILLNVINLAQLQLEDLRDQQRGNDYPISIPEFLISLGMDRILLDKGDTYIPITKDTYGYSPASKLKAIYGSIGYARLYTSQWENRYSIDSDQAKKVAKYIKDNSMGVSRDGSTTYHYLISGDLIMILDHSSYGNTILVMTKDAFIDGMSMSIHAGKGTVSMYVIVKRSGDSSYNESMRIPSSMVPAIKAWIQDKPLPPPIRQESTQPKASKRMSTMDILRSISI